MSRRPAQSTRNFFASGKPQALGFWSCGEAVSEQAACLGVRTPPLAPHGRLHSAGLEQASRRGSHHVRRSRGTDTRDPAALGGGVGDSGAEATTGHGRAWAERAGPGSPWFRGVRHKRYSLTARAQDQRKEEPELTPHALPWWAEPLLERNNGIAPPVGEGKGCHFESSPLGS